MLVEKGFQKVVSLEILMELVILNMVLANGGGLHRWPKCPMP